MKIIKILGIIIFIFSSRLLRADEPHAASLKCPESQADDDMDSWRSAALEKALGGKYGEVSDAFKNCFPQGAPRCLKAVEEYVEMKKYPDLNSNLYKSELRPAQIGYIETPLKLEPVTPLTLQSEKDLPKEFTVEGKPGLIRFPPNILKLAKAKAWKALAYKTRSSGGFDQSPNLVLVAIPGRDKDIYLQISPNYIAPMVETANDPYPEAGVDLSKGLKTLTIITVDKRKSPPEGQMREIVDYGDGYKWTNKLSSQTFIGCHTKPLCAISPSGYLINQGNEKRMKPEDEKSVQEINDMMLVEGLSWGAVSVDGHEVQRGPYVDSQPYGWSPANSEETRSPEAIKQCAQSQRPIAYSDVTQDLNYKFQPSGDPTRINAKHIANAMNCIQCHNSKIRGFLHDQFQESEIKFKILVDKSMPPGAELNDDERIALYNCLIAEKDHWSETWIKTAPWAKRENCQSASIGRPNPYPRARKNNSTPAGASDTRH